MSNEVHVIGAGLAGAEAAWQITRLGLKVVLHEMRPGKLTPAHKTGDFAELVCSNSFKSKSRSNASGLLKEELSRLGSLIMSCAVANELPAGQALAVDRDLFAKCVSDTLTSNPLVTVIEEEVTKLSHHPDEPWVIASGPLTSDALALALQDILGESYLYFFDAIAPIVTAESLDMSKVFRASRYDKGDADYLNCPMSKEQYMTFLTELLAAECHPGHDFEKTSFFEGCIPIEEMAKRGAKTLAFGPLKPVGLKPPDSDLPPYAVVQLRQDNVSAELYNLVGFQTNLRYAEQDRVFRLIPGLEEAKFVRYGTMHRNLFINSPRLLEPSLRFKEFPLLFCAGQMTGVEGYLESAATGWLAGQNAARVALDREVVTLPPTTVMGALLHYITHAAEDNFQPMNAIFGIMPPLNESGKRLSKKERQEEYAGRSLSTLSEWMKKV